jgi:hypothetical protein
MAVRFNRARWNLGRQNQTALVPFLEQFLGEKIIETTKLYDTIDGKTETRDIEIKSRSANYDWQSGFIMRDGWLLPCCKIDHAKTSGRPFVCFYYWMKDGSVWQFEYTPEAMAGLQPFVPSWHKDKQAHYSIPFDRWKRVGSLA